MTDTQHTSLKDKICLVTGGTRGIGFEIAKMLCQEGAKVVIGGREQATVDRAVDQLKALPHDKVAGKAADLRSHDKVGELFGFVDTTFGDLDVLVNNAGVGMFAPLGELEVEQWRSTLETNLYGVYYASRAALPRFRTRGKGYIVNISSLAGAHAFAGGAAYNASKFGLTGLSEAMMQDLRGQGVRVSYVMPGSVATEFGGGDGESGRDWKIWPEDIAEVVRTLLRMPERTLVSRVEVRPARPKR